MVLNNHMLAKLRQVAAQYLKDTCTIQAQAFTRDRYGGVDASQWNVVAENVACRIILQSGSGNNAPQAVGDQESLIDEYRLIVPVGTGLAPNQRVICNGVTYQVTQIITSRTDETDEQAMITRARID